MSQQHECPRCGTPHYPKGQQLDRAISGFLVGVLLAGLVFGLNGCAVRPRQERVTDRGMVVVRGGNECCGNWP